jgi:hypothetical protein
MERTRLLTWLTYAHPFEASLPGTARKPTGDCTLKETSHDRAAPLQLHLDQTLALYRDSLAIDANFTRAMDSVIRRGCRLPRRTWSRSHAVPKIAAGGWIDAHKTLISSGPTGIGKN